MLTTIESYLRGGRIRTWLADSRVRQTARWGWEAVKGFCFSAASLANLPMPLTAALVGVQSGWHGAVMALGGILGYLAFWGQAGAQGVVWTLLGLAAGLALAKQKTQLLLPAVLSLIVAGTGLFFQIYHGDNTPVGWYILRVVLAGGALQLFRIASPFARWAGWGFWVLALAQIAPIPWLGLGFVAAGLLCTSAPFPAAALGGLALDLATVTKTPMAAVACLCCGARVLPQKHKSLSFLLPVGSYILVMTLSGVWDWKPIPALVLGGIVGTVYPVNTQTALRRGSTGTAQVRLELAAEVFSQTQQLLLEAGEGPVDEEAVVAMSVERACTGCPCRKDCREREHMEKLPVSVLHRPVIRSGELPLSCKKTGRVAAELQRGQVQLRGILADRQRKQDYRNAVIQQYQFAGTFVRELADTLGNRLREPRIRYRAEVTVYANREKEENGDRCAHFTGSGGKYYVALCDGMGTGTGAREEGETALQLLRRMLQAGYPAEHALRSLNSLCILRGREAAVTVDLAELCLDTGRAAVYKWGAEPSLLLTRVGAEKIGTAGPPPGLSVTQARETVERLSLRAEEVLLLLSDGVGGEEALRSCSICSGERAGEVARRLLEQGSDEDDATVVTIRLSSASSATA